MFLLRGFFRLLFLGLAGWGMLVAAVYLYGRLDGARSADAIVVLGAAQYAGRPSPVLQARLDHAISLYEQGLAPTLILTGGVGARDTLSEAEVAERYAVRAGVPASAILTEERGLRSVESLEAVAELMQDRGLESAIMVSDPFHMLRLQVLARRFGIRALSSPTRTSPISRDREWEWRYVLRESLIIPLALVRMDL